ncbi:MAG TPA: HNH endonuclease [Chloroflexota bacterium]
MASRPALPPATRIQILRRDGWLCRYCGRKTIFEPVMRLLGALFPDDFPHHPNWKNGYTHPAVLTRTAEVDHIVPGSRGGSWTDPENLVACCSRCNTSKADLTLEEVGWTIRSVPEASGWHGLTELYPALWEAAGRPDASHHGIWIAQLRRTEVS